MPIDSRNFPEAPCLDGETGCAEAIAHHEAGRLDQAEAAYRTILAQHPAHAESLHLLGLITAQRGDAAAAAELIQRAMAMRPGHAPHHNSLAFAWQCLGRIEDAITEYRSAAALRPHSAEIHNNLATALHDFGRRDEALTHYRHAAANAPDSPQIWYNLANALAENGAAVEAETAFRRALALNPHYSDALANYGRWLITQARWSEAEAQLDAVIRLNPAHAPAWNNRAVALAEQGRFEAAEAAYRQALSIDPTSADSQYNLGCLLQGLGRADDAAACQAAALAANPRHGAAALAFCMAQLPVLYCTEVDVSAHRQRYTAALQALDAASHEPAVAAALGVAIGTSQPFFLAYQNEDDRLLQSIYGQIACRVVARTTPQPHLPPRPASGARIRLGIVSGFFCDHTLFKLFLEGWIIHLDRTRFEVIGFHTGHTMDGQTARAAAGCDRFIQGPLSIAGWRQAVLAATPDVLLYPEIGIHPTAARLAAERLARVQCVAWGHPDTTGMPTIDHFLSSELMEPPEGDAYYTEDLVRLPNLGTCYLPDDRPALRLDRMSLGLRPGVPLFWSGQALYKYLPRYDIIYPHIAEAVGPCQFVFIAFAKSPRVTELFRRRLQQAFASRGLDADAYCVILPPLSQQRFVAAVGLADVVLDTPGWSGGKSTLDCLAQDPAIVTWPGRFMRGRHTAAILRRIGCEAMIAGSADEYVSIATRLALDAGWRAEIRQTVLRGKTAAFEDKIYMQALERFMIDAATSWEPSVTDKR